MTITCEIIFDDNPDKVFYPGQNVVGHIELKVNKQTEVKGISYVFSGNALVKFSHKRGRTRTFYTEKEPYFEQRVYLVSNGQDDETVEIGTYNYPFSQEFPHELPSSIEAPNGRNCHVRYSIEVVIDNPHWFDTKFIEYFTHIKPFDLNIYPLFRGPIIKSESTTYYWGGCCVLIESKPIHVKVRLPSAGYAPGQTINVVGDVDNRSNVNVAFDVKLVQHFDLIIKQTTLVGVHTLEKEKKFTVAEQESFCTNRAGSKNEFETSLVIPPLPPSNQENSKIFRVKYYVCLVWRAGFLHKLNIISMPIVIGTYPYVNQNAKIHENGFSSSGPYPKNDPPIYEEIACDKVQFCPVSHVYRHPVVPGDD